MGGGTPSQKIMKNVRRDKAKESYLLNRNYNFLVLWEKDINEQLEWCVEQIKASMKVSQ